MRRDRFQIAIVRGTADLHVFDWMPADDVVAIKASRVLCVRPESALRERQRRQD
jgi:hypothetical protein